MKWLSNGFRTIFWCIALGAIILGFLSVILEMGHKTARIEEARTEEKGTAIPNAVASLNLVPSSGSLKNPVGCNEALDALALCSMSRNTGKQLNDDEAVSANSAVDRAPEKIVSRPIVNAAQVSVGAPFPLLPVLAFGLAVAGALLGAFNFCAILWREKREDAIRRMMAQSLEFLGYNNGFEIDGLMKKSTTAAVAKERLLQCRA